MFFEMDEQQGQGGRGDAWDASGLREVFGLHVVEFFRDFRRQAADAGVVEVGGQGMGAVFREFVHFRVLAFDVACVFGVDVDLFDDVGGKPGGVEAGQGGEGCVVEFGTFQEFGGLQVLAEPRDVFQSLGSAWPVLVQQSRRCIVWWLFW